MRTDEEIRKMFEDMGLGSEEERSQFSFAYGCDSKSNYLTITIFHVDTKTEDLKEEKHAELE